MTRPRTSEDVKKALFKRLSNQAVKTMTIPQATAALRTLSKKGRGAADRRAGVAADIAAARLRFAVPFDLTPYRTKEAADDSGNGD